MYKLDIPDDLPRREIDAELPRDWVDRISITQGIGDSASMSGQICLLIVPSAIIPLDKNYLLFGASRAIRRVKIVETHPIRLDRRLFD